MPSSPLFADDNSAYRRAQRRTAKAEREREERREKIMATLRRLRSEIGQAGVAAECPVSVLAVAYPSRSPKARFA